MKKTTTPKSNKNPNIANNTEDQTIVVTIAERPYKLNVKQGEEVHYRKAANIINERFENYATKFATNFALKTKEDILALITLKHSVLALQNGCDLTFDNKKQLKK